MSEALERVIADQQKVIDRQRLAIDQNNDYLQRNYRQREELKDAAFSFINQSTPENRNALKQVLRNQGWCLYCETQPCECDE